MYSLGIELSTQSVKTVILDLDKAAVIHTDAFEYDTALPEYETEGGVLRSRDKDIRHTSPFMLIQALEMAFTRLLQAGIDMAQILQASQFSNFPNATSYPQHGDQLFQELTKIVLRCTVRDA